jgi:hypothetical protein
MMGYQRFGRWHPAISPHDVKIQEDHDFHEKLMWQLGFPMRLEGEIKFVSFHCVYFFWVSAF